MACGSTAPRWPMPMACAPTRRRGRASCCARSRPADAGGGARETLVAETLVTGGRAARVSWGTFRRFPLVADSRGQPRRNIGRIGIGGGFRTFRYPFEGVASGVHPCGETAKLRTARGRPRSRARHRQSMPRRAAPDGKLSQSPSSSTWADPSTTAHRSTHWASCPVLLPKNGSNTLIAW